MRLIDADALNEKLEALMQRYAAQGRMEVADDYNFVITVLSTAPTIEAAPVKHGRWENTTEFFPWQEDDGLRRYHCSVCGKRVTVSREHKITDIFPYCNCGAKMDEEGET